LVPGQKCDPWSKANWYCVAIDSEFINATDRVSLYHTVKDYSVVKGIGSEYVATMHYDDFKNGRSVNTIHFKPDYKVVNCNGTRIALIGSMNYSRQSREYTLQMQCQLTEEGVLEIDPRIVDLTKTAVDGAAQKCADYKANCPSASTVEVEVYSKAELEEALTKAYSN